MSTIKNLNQTTLATVPKKLQSKSLPIIAGSATPQQAQVFKQLVEAAHNGSTEALGRLCTMFEPLFLKEARREIFYNTLGAEEGLSLARLKFIELVLNYNGADYTHFAGYVRCRVHYALYDEARKIWNGAAKTAPLPNEGEEESAEFCDNPIEREELSLLLSQALAKLTLKQRSTILALYFKGYKLNETAKLMKITPAMAAKHHKQALKNLRGKIA